MKFIPQYLIAALIFILVGCDKQGEAGKKNTSENVNISGQVFVVTKGRENIKLALVEVAAIPEKELAQYIKSQHDRGLEQQKLLMPELESVEKEARAAAAAAERAEKEFNKPGLSEKRADDYFNSQKIMDQKNSSSRKIKNKFDYFDSAEYYFEKLPAQLVVSKTDADGKFTLPLPAGKYALAAKSSRDAFGKTENYYWLVWVDTSSPNHSLMLSNDNFFETKCNECVKP